ncbi:hypothetical protein CRG98_003307 [Punica granatum]|uniref:Uncharacterized protein n=1 Tax=Punica granatum TaxID=22663 RepID=A0A2I0L6G7_PUNGR|nr:hypothetical protein CRG98_003307 [Punica granatum]
MGLSQCFSSILMCSETTVISVCQKRVPNACREEFVTIETSLGRSAYFRVPFTSPQIGRPGSPFKKASTNVQECPDLSRRLLKCAWRCHWSFWYQEGFLESHIGCLPTLRRSVDE